MRQREESYLNEPEDQRCSKPSAPREMETPSTRMPQPVAAAEGAEKQSGSQSLSRFQGRFAHLFTGPRLEVIHGAEQIPGPHPELTLSKP